MRINDGIPNRRGHPIDELIRGGVLDALRFVVYLVVGVTERDREIRLEHAMTPNRS